MVGGALSKTIVCESLSLWAATCSRTLLSSFIILDAIGMQKEDQAVCTALSKHINHRPSTAMLSFGTFAKAKEAEIVRLRWNLWEGTIDYECGCWLERRDMTRDAN